MDAAQSVGGGIDGGPGGGSVEESGGDVVVGEGCRAIKYIGGQFITHVSSKTSFFWFCNSYLCSIQFLYAPRKPTNMAHSSTQFQLASAT